MEASPVQVEVQPGLGGSPRGRIDPPHEIAVLVVRADDVGGPTTAIIWEELLLRHWHGRSRNMTAAVAMRPSRQTAVTTFRAASSRSAPTKLHAIDKVAIAATPHHQCMTYGTKMPVTLDVATMARPVATMATRARRAASRFPRRHANQPVPATAAIVRHPGHTDDVVVKPRKPES